MREALKMLLALALAALLATGLSACGGSDSHGSTASSTAATTTEQTTPTGAGAGESHQPAASDEGSASFRTPGGDNSIQEYGKEADSGEVDEATAALSAYLEARAGDDWKAMCASLAKATVAPMEQLASHTPRLKGKGCAAVLETLMGSMPSSAQKNTLTAGIASLRVEGDRGFALYHGAGGVDYFMPMAKEDGEWKVGAIAPSEFP
jgi:hypothetical protein